MEKFLSTNSVKTTYICCCNDTEQLETMLFPSFNRIKEGRNIELIVIKTKEKGYASAASAFNTELNLHKSSVGDIIVFLHQDIAFDNDDFHKYIVDYLSKHPNTIIGVAGSFEYGDKRGSNLRYYKTKEFIETPIDEELNATAVDECCFAMTKEVFFRQMFDEKSCFHWHLYASDFCYQARLKYNTRVIVSPIGIYHKMDGTQGLGIDKYYLRTLWRLILKYHKNVPELHVTCYETSTNLFIAAAKLLKTFMSIKRNARL